MAFHDLVLHLDGEGGWTLHDAASGDHLGGGGEAEGGAGKARAGHSKEVLEGMTLGVGLAKEGRGEKNGENGGGAESGAAGGRGGDILARAPERDEDEERESKVLARALALPRGRVVLGARRAVGAFVELLTGAGGDGRGSVGRLVSADMAEGENEGLGAGWCWLEGLLWNKF